MWGIPQGMQNAECWQDPKQNGKGSQQPAGWEGESYGRWGGGNGKETGFSTLYGGDQQSDDWTTPLGQAARPCGQNDFEIRSDKRKEADDGSLPLPLPSRKRGWTWTPSFPSCPGSQGQPGPPLPPSLGWSLLAAINCFGSNPSDY